MSTLLKEAIIDAAALKEAALKNAEASIIEKYSTEVKEHLNQLLEQEEDPLAGADIGLGDLDQEAATPPAGEEATPESTEDIVGDDVPLAALDDIDGAGNSSAGSPVEFNLNIDTLQEAIRALSDQLNEDIEYDLTENEIQAILEDDMTVDASAGVQSADESEAEEKEFEGSDEGGLAEDVELDEEIDADTLLDAVMERLTVDMGATLSGWAGRSSESQKWEMEKELAHRRSTDMQDELDVLRKAQEELVFENKQLKEQITQYEQATQGLKEGLQDVNLSNARLLYTNRVLRNTSLNERQKDRIVEAISHAGSVTEARTIFDTLQSTVESTPKRGPQSLSEAITRNRSSVIRASRHERPSSDPLQERMKRLAGIK
tara:strand:- start:6415 stop:7539 length:1125 start_codon:yes stop_codon:yes gene_type:complete